MPKPTTIEDPGPHASRKPERWALWDLGFRPFYMLASVFAALSIPLWVAQYAGILPSAYLRSAAVHGHEMLFGYTLAVITGFLFTAGRNWTGQPTPTGAALMAFAALWLAGRVLMLTPWGTAAAMVNAAFPVAVALALGIALLKSRNTRNYFFVALLFLFGMVSLALHFSSLGALAWTELATLQLGLDLVLFIIAVMGGRVIPMFTNNGVPGTQATRHPWIEKFTLGSILALLAADLLQAGDIVIAAVAVAAALANALRLARWQPWRTLGTPLVWILHAGYGWIVVYLVLRALSALGMVAEPFAIHALTIGVIGSMTIGMMTRTSRGHTGRPLVADHFEVACYILIQCAALTRVFGGMLLPHFYLMTVIVSGVCWSAGFGIFAIRYWPILSRGRIDGKPG